MKKKISNGKISFSDKDEIRSFSSFEGSSSEEGATSSSEANKTELKEPLTASTAEVRDFFTRIIVTQIS